LIFLLMNCWINTKIQSDSITASEAKNRGKKTMKCCYYGSRDCDISCVAYQIQDNIAWCTRAKKIKLLELTEQQIEAWSVIVNSTQPLVTYSNLKKEGVL
jgi:hypothetical protein